MLNRVLARTQNFLSSSHLGLHFAVRLQNQCRAIVSRSHGATVADVERNGEGMILRHVADRLRYFIDVGANIGAWTENALKAPDIKAGLLFEPAGPALNILRERLGHCTILDIVPAAVGDCCCDVLFYEELKAGETSSVIGAAADPRSVAKKVRMTTLDTEIDRLGWPSIDYLKIDAEGYDFHVLRGSTTLLKSHRVALGQFEYGDGWRLSGSTLTYAIRWLADLGYECFLLKSSGLYIPEPAKYGEYFGYSNYVFCHLEGKTLIRSLIRGRL
jgi:FkbM family methyltransferase